MANFSDNPPAKIKMEMQDPATGTKFTEEPFSIDFNVFNDIAVTQGGSSSGYFINELSDCMNTVLTLTGASCIAKHVIYDISITD